MVDTEGSGEGGVWVAPPGAGQSWFWLPDSDTERVGPWVVRRKPWVPRSQDLTKTLENHRLDVRSRLVIRCARCVAPRPKIAAVVSTRERSGQIGLCWFNFEAVSYLDNTGRRVEAIGWVVCIQNDGTKPARITCRRCGRRSSISQGEVRRRLKAAPYQELLCDPDRGLLRPPKTKPSRVHRADHSGPVGVREGHASR